MSRKMYWKPVVIDIENNGCDEEEVEMLCDIFEHCMKQIACTLMTRGFYELKNFSDAKKREIDGFSLTMEKYPHAGQEQWIGVFEAAGKKLKIFGGLEPVD